MVNESECFLLWAIPEWDQWASFEAAAHADSPLCPFRTGRQPSREDRTRWEN